MAKKTKNSPPAAEDDLNIPTFLKRDKNELRGEDKEVVAPAPAAPEPKSKYGALKKPQSMSDEEYERRTAEFEKPEQTKPERTKKTAKAERPSDTFRIADWANDNDLDPRKVRMVARANEKTLKPLWANGLKHTFKNSDKAKVEKTIHDGFAAAETKTVKKPKAAKTKIPPPSETVWAGKAKVTRPKPIEPVVSAKEKARAEGKKAVRVVGKKNIKKIPTK